MIVVGSLNVDLVVGLERMPSPGETVMGSTLERHPGGKGLNQAVACARLGATVLMVGAVGSDDAGDWLRSIAESEGIDVANVSTVDGPSGTALIEVDSSGQNRIVVVPGANDQVTPVQVREAIAQAAAEHDRLIVLAQGEIPLAAISAAMEAGRDHGATTILNPAPARDYPDALVGLVDVLVPNEHEAASLSGINSDDDAGALDSARSLLARGCRVVVMTRGAQGSLWVSSDATGAVSAFPVDAIDTVAAGDAFCGGLVSALAQGFELTDALQRASAAGSLATTRVGAVPSLPTLRQVEDLLG